MHNTLKYNLEVLRYAWQYLFRQGDVVCKKNHSRLQYLSCYSINVVSDVPCRYNGFTHQRFSAITGTNIKWADDSLLLSMTCWLFCARKLWITACWRHIPPHVFFWLWILILKSLWTSRMFLQITYWKGLLILLAIRICSNHWFRRGLLLSLGFQVNPGPPFWFKNKHGGSFFIVRSFKINIWVISYSSNYLTKAAKLITSQKPLLS